MEQNQQLLQESFKFINNNFDTYSNELPDHLLDFWMATSEEFDIEDTHTWTVFIYITNVREAKKGKNSFKISEEELIRQYENWQIALSVIEINRKTDMKFEPFKLFDLDIEIRKIV